MTQRRGHGGDAMKNLFSRLIWLLAVWGLCSIPGGASTAITPIASFEEDGIPFTRAASSTFRWKGLLAVYDVDLGIGPGTLREKPLDGGAVRMEFTYHRGFTSREIVEGGNALLAKNVSVDELEAVKSRLEQLNRAYVDVRPGDRYALTFSPGRGLTLRLNGKPLVTVEGDDFARRYLRIWLGPEPINTGLRDRLLGTSR
jgi:hypothetical protein